MLSELFAEKSPDNIKVPFRSISWTKNNLTGTIMAPKFVSFNFVDKPSDRTKREVFDLPSPINYHQDFTIETLVVADKKMTDFHGVEELKIYVPSLINIVSFKNAYYPSQLLPRRALEPTQGSQRSVLHNIPLLGECPEGLGCWNFRKRIPCTPVVSTQVEVN